MKFFLSLVTILITAKNLQAQSALDTINKKEATRIVSYLASDTMKGRVNGSYEQLEAARFISDAFAGYGIDSIPGFQRYFHEFELIVDDHEHSLFNIIGMLPGKTRPGEIIIISAHYDHVDEAIDGRREKDEIFNGANDNASGTTAVLLLAKYFAAMKNNERTIIFCLFAGEELGLWGSKSLVRQVTPDSIKAVINIEMIGRTNWSGKNAFNVVGSRYTTIDEILKKNLAGSAVKVKNDFSDTKSLYERSDHYSFALKGIPSVTIMCSDDYDPCYHRACDEVKRLDIDNMVKIIQAIAIGITTMVSGTDSPVVTWK